MSINLNLKGIFHDYIWIIALFIIGHCLLLFASDKGDFPIIAYGYIISFIGYYYLYHSDVSFKSLIILGVLVRLLAVFSFPHLSDDIYRFIWDGMQWLNGANPFAYLPSQQLNPSSYELMLINRMNSPDYYSIYPPILQGIFIGTSYIIPSPLHFQIIFLKLVLLSFECLTAYFGIKSLKLLQLDTRRFILYWLNPLVIIELMGNLHMEVIMISFLAICIFYLIKEKLYIAGLLWGLSISSKLITLILLPFIVKKYGLLKSIKFVIPGIITVLVLFAITLGNNAIGMLSSLDLYFQKFEFNASIYYIIRYFGFQINGYNLIQQIGPILAMVTIVIILFQFLKFKYGSSIPQVLKAAIISLTTYWLLSTTIHPWYVTTIVFMAIFTNFKFPYIWSGLIILSYFHYYDVENSLWIVGIEYVLLFGWILYELSQTKKAQIN